MDIFNTICIYYNTAVDACKYLEKVGEDGHLGVLDASPPDVHVVPEDGVEGHLLQRSHGLSHGIENSRDLQINNQTSNQNHTHHKKKKMSSKVIRGAFKQKRGRWPDKRQEGEGRESMPQPLDLRELKHSHQPSLLSF